MDTSTTEGNGLITDERSEDQGPETTSTFADYFNLNHDVIEMKKELKSVLGNTDAPAFRENITPHSHSRSLHIATWPSVQLTINSRASLHVFLQRSCLSSR